MDAWYVHVLSFLDKHPIAFVSVLLVAGAIVIVVGLPLPQRSVRQTKDGIETVWSLRGGIPGIGRGLVEVARAIVKVSETNASEREQARTAHAAELAQQRTIMEAVQDEQQRTTNAIVESNMTMRAIAADFHSLVSWLHQHVSVDVRSGKPDKPTDGSRPSTTPLPVVPPPRTSQVGTSAEHEQPRA